MNALYRVHVLLISMASVFCAFYGFLGFRNPDLGGPVLAGASLVMSAALGGYLAWFLRAKRVQPPR